MGSVRLNIKSNWSPERCQSVIAQHQHQAGALLPVLHAIQEEFGYIDREAIPLVAEALNLSRADVHGVISFYHDFRVTPPGRHILKICRAEACQSMGCDELIGHVESRLNVKLGETTPDRSFTVEAVFCLGNCALSPSVLLDGEPFGRVTAQVADFLIDHSRRQA